MIKKIIRAIYLLVNNPQLFFKKLIARIKTKQRVPYSPSFKKINGILFEFDFDFDYNNDIKEMYFGDFELETVELMKKVLKKGDVFLDLGANIGYLSAIGAGFVGKEGEVHSFEPVPELFQRLEEMAFRNKDYKIRVNQLALGEKRGRAKVDITNRPNIGWNTMVPGFMSNETKKQSIEVPVYRLDDYIKEKKLKLDKISLIKIDAEGFEFPILKGLQNYFENTKYRPVIYCEIAPAAYPLLGYTLGQLSDYMKKYSYRSFSSIKINKEINITELKKTTNVVFKTL